jgi:hypothetical protein
VQEEHDMEWFRQGGWGMFPVLIVGLVSLGSAAFFAARGDAGLRPSLQALSRALVGFMMMALLWLLVAVGERRIAQRLA